MIRRLAIAAAMGAALFLSFGGFEPALAAEAAATTATGALTTAQPLGSSVVNLSPLVSLIWQIGLAVIPVLLSAVLAFGASFLKNKTGIALSQDAQQTVEHAFQNGVNLAAVHLQTIYKGKLTVDTHNALAATVVNYVIDHAPDALKQLGIDPAKNAENIAEKALARLAGAGIVPSAAGTVEASIPAVPAAPGIGLLSGNGVAPMGAPVVNAAQAGAPVTAV